MSLLLIHSTLLLYNINIINYNKKYSSWDFVSILFHNFYNSNVNIENTYFLRITRLPGAVPQPLFLLLIFFGCILFFRSFSSFKEIEAVFFFQNKLGSSSIFKNIIVFSFNCFGLHYFF